MCREYEQAPTVPGGAELRADSMFDLAEGAGDDQSQAILESCPARHYEVPRRTREYVQVAIPTPPDGNVLLPNALETELAELRARVGTLQSENLRLIRLLELSPQVAAIPSPEQMGIFDSPPGSVHAKSTPAEKVAFFATLFAARRDVYAERWTSVRSGKDLPAGVKDGSFDRDEAALVAASKIP